MRDHLLLRFGIVSAVLAALLGAALIHWLGGFIRSSNLARATDTVTYSLGFTLDAIGVSPTQSTTINAQQYAETTKLLSSMVKTGRFVGATAWSRQGALVFPLDPLKQARARPQLAEALEGRVVTAVVTKPAAGVVDPVEARTLKDGPLLEVFAPVRLQSGVQAVVVFYERWEPVERLIKKETREVTLLVAGGLVVVWLGLVRLVWGASRKLRSQAEENWTLASHDSLTGLPNRKMLRELVNDALKSARKANRSMGLLLLDLDRFKEVNDTLGHHFGDLLLQQIGPRLAAVLRDGDCVARLGGDEFVVVLADVEDSTAAADVARRIMAAISVPMTLGGAQVDVGASIGIAISPQHGANFDDLLQHADIAMYAAKTNGGGFSIYTADADTASPGRLALLHDLRAATEASDQLVLHYQPKADLVTGEVASFEALVRWQHPTRGLLPPSEFIPLAERTGLIHAVTNRVLHMALEQARTWADDGLHVPVSINISTRLLEPSLPELVSRLLTENRTAAGTLILEITESSLMADLPRAVKVLAQLESLGVRLSIDDFGTGYSSMAYLKRLPVHEIKIDRSFIADITTSPTDALIVSSCIELGHNLGLTVVAEGVENCETWSHLTELGCDLAQGYYLAKPMPAEDVLTWTALRWQQVSAPEHAG